MSLNETIRGLKGKFANKFKREEEPIQHPWGVEPSYGNIIVAFDRRFITDVYNLPPMSSGQSYQHNAKSAEKGNNHAQASSFADADFYSTPLSDIPFRPN